MGTEELPRRGVLRVYRSSVLDACDRARREENRENCGQEGNRASGRPEDLSHRETPALVEFVLPRPLGDDLQVVNDIEWDDKPRLVNKYETSMRDIAGMIGRTSVAGRSAEAGRWDLGYHELRSVAFMSLANLSSRPPKDGHNDDSIRFLKAVRAIPSEDPRWMKFAHLRGEDRCKSFLGKTLLTLVGPRPTRVE